MKPKDTFTDRLSVTGTANALELRGLSRTFGALMALDDINITLRPGERRAVLGSTLSKHCLLYTSPSPRDS